MQGLTSLLLFPFLPFFPLRLASCVPLLPELPCVACFVPGLPLLVAGRLCRLAVVLEDFPKSGGRRQD